MIHILFTLTGCEAGLIDDEAYVRQVLYDACAKAGTTWLQTASHKFSPQVPHVLCTLKPSLAAVIATDAK